MLYRIIRTYIIWLTSLVKKTNRNQSNNMRHNYPVQQIVIFSRKNTLFFLIKSAYTFSLLYSHFILRTEMGKKCLLLLVLYEAYQVFPKYLQSFTIIIISTQKVLIYKITISNTTLVEFSPFSSDSSDAFYFWPLQICKIYSNQDGYFMEDLHSTFTWDGG